MIISNMSKSGKLEKLQADRIAECVRIRGQLTSMGICQIEKNKELIKARMNDFILHGIANRFQLKVDNIVYDIILSNTRTSGVTMITC